jgi:hypothetical protein
MLNVTDPHSRGFARLTGLFYLIIVVAGVFSIAYVPSVLLVPGSPGETLANIAHQRGLFHLGLLGDAVLMAAEIMVTAMLYVMFRGVNDVIALAAAMARFAMVAVMAAMLFFQAGTMMALDRPDLLAGLGDGSAQAVAALMLHLHGSGVAIWQIFFTMHLVLLGWLVMRSGCYPRLLGYGLMLGAFGYLTDTVAQHLYPDVAWLEMLRIGLLAIVTLSEIGFALWLTFIGPRQRGLPS